MMTRLSVNDDKFGRSSLTESTGSQKENITKTEHFLKQVLLIDDDPDVTTVFGLGLQDEGFDVHTYNDPLEALSQFRPNFYDLLLIDINMPKMNGIDLSIRILELDTNVKICFVTAGEANIEVLRELYPTRSIGCYIKKPVTIENLVRRIKAELELPEIQVVGWLYDRKNVRLTSRDIDRSHICAPEPKPTSVAPDRGSRISFCCIYIW